LNAPGFNQPLNLKCDILVSKFGFKCSLYRYSLVFDTRLMAELTLEQEQKAGLYELNPVDPSLESAWFQPFSL
jgi:hypothetical protein